jgi:nucleotide-binding universal stress UspA family protein
VSCLVCATRGGPGSRASQEKAITYAAEQKSELIFLYVVDISMIEEVDNKLKIALLYELSWLGRVILRIAQKRADNAQIVSEIVIREGTVKDEICQFLEERSADLLLLGAPRGTTTAIFGDDSIDLFAQEIKETSGVPVEIVRPEEIQEE